MRFYFALLAEDLAIWDILRQVELVLILDRESRAIIYQPNLETAFPWSPISWALSLRVQRLEVPSGPVSTQWYDLASGSLYDGLVDSDVGAGGFSAAARGLCCAGYIWHLNAPLCYGNFSCIFQGSSPKPMRLTNARFILL